jgi:L-alanine-DL-glutamate epimerase-like enolase superfamily enzyme
MVSRGPAALALTGQPLAKTKRIGRRDGRGYLPERRTNDVSVLECASLVGVTRCSNMSASRIAAVVAKPVTVRRSSAFRSALGVSTAASFGIVTVETATGLRGLGEISMIWNGDGAALCPLVNDILGPALIGLDAFDINRAHQRMDAAVQFSRAANPAKASIDMALYDIAGKLLDTPAYNLLGGRVRDIIPLSMSIAMAPLEEMVAQSRLSIKHGFKGVKIKVGVDQAHDLRAVKAIREAIGKEAILRIDANMGWRSAREALIMICALAPFEIHSVEQPLPADSIDGLAWLRQASPIPIMVDESVWGPDDAHRIIQAGAADMINVYVSEAGGLRNAARIFSMAEMAGVQCTIGSMPELGIGTAAAMHLAVSVPDLLGPSDVCGVLYNSETFIHETLPIGEGLARVPDGPGLGVSLDDERLAALSALG